MNACALVLVVLCVLALHTRAHCPRLCDCKWKGGKESVLCPRANLTRIPSKLDAGTQLLDLTENPIALIQRDAFLSAGLLNLQKIFITKCRLKSIDRNAFRKLINLVELDLSYNALSSVPSHIFESIPELRELKLSGNPIQRVLNEAFIHVPQLVRLELSDCRLGSVEPRSFGGLEQSLEWLKLDRNRLSDVKSATITSLLNLHGLELANNPWNCTCSLRPLREWMLKQNVPNGMPPACRFPTRVAGRSWDRMELDDFACAPDIKPIQQESSAEEGDNITLSCRIGGDPPPRILWLLRNRVLTNTSTPGRRNYLVRTKGTVSSLTIMDTEVQDAGSYLCAAENVAGKSEATVKLAISKRVGSGTSGNVMFAAGATAALMLLTICLLFFGLKAARKKQRPHQAACSRHRTDSYEKIEMNHKINHINLSNNVGESTSHRNDPVSVAVGAIRKRGDYRNVPSQDTEDEAETYDEDMETPTPSSEARGIASWRNIPQPTWPAPREPIKSEDTDLHIPRLNEFKEPRNILTPESNSSCSQYNDFTNSNIQNKVNNNTNPADTNLQIHQFRRQMIPNTRGSNIYAPNQTNKIDDQNNISIEIDKNNFPDLLEMNANATDPIAQNITLYNIEEKRDNFFYTLPRKGNVNVRSINRHQRDSESSQSPLLPESRYGSSGGESSLGSNSNRRLSVESYSQYGLSNGIGKPGQRSNSFINLASSTVVRGGAPSLPGSPASATPLLEIRGLPKSEMTRAPIVSHNSTMPLTYDYHAAQLERFLEEYRSLQEQLCKMKETCENISGSRDKQMSSSGRVVADPLFNNCNIVTPTSSEECGIRSQVKSKSTIAVISSNASGNNILPDSSSPLTISPATDLSGNISPWSTTNSHLQRLNKNSDFFRS